MRKCVDCGREFEPETEVTTGEVWQTACWTCIETHGAPSRADFNELLALAGLPPVRGRKIAYFRERVFQRRLRPAPDLAPVAAPTSSTAPDPRPTASTGPTPPPRAAGRTSQR